METTVPVQKTNMQIPVLLADDHIVFREGLRAMLEHEKDIAVVGEAATGAQAIELAEKLSPSIVVVDLSLPLQNGFEVMRRIRILRPETRFVVLTAHCEEGYINRSFELGAHGFVSKENPFKILAEAIRHAAEDKKYVCPLVQNLRDLTKDRRSGTGAERPEDGEKRLTARELQVLKLVAEGHANKQVAIALQISIKTVEKHRQQLMDKLNLHDTASLTRYAIAAGVIKSIIPRPKDFS